MTVAIDLKEGRYTFAERGHLHITVPEGSAVLPVMGLGLVLFVPTDRLVRRGWEAAEVLRAVREKAGPFRVARVRKVAIA